MSEIRPLLENQAPRAVWHSGEAAVTLYRATQIGLGWVPRMLFWTRRYGLEKIPRRGPVILASNHPSYLDAPLVVASIPRPVFYLGKHTLFTNPLGSLVLRRLGGQIPVDRETGGNEDALAAGLKVLSKGLALGICPEGTRSADGNLKRGRTGVAVFAYLTGVPVFPVGIKGTFRAWPVHKKLPRFFTRTEIVVDDPVIVPKDPRAADNARRCRELTDEIMRRLGALVDLPYVV